MSEKSTAVLAISRRPVKLSQVLVRDAAIMQKSLWIILSALVLSIVAPNAHADSFTPTFTCSGTCVSIPTAPDVSFPPNTITETWNGFTMTLSLDPSDKPTDDYTWSNEVIVEELFVEDVVQFFVFDTTNNTFAANMIILGPQPSHPTDSGLLSFSPVATPEPSSLALMLLGIGLVFWVRKHARSGPFTETC
jgi:hypothetical protein